MRNDSGRPQLEERSPGWRSPRAFAWAALALAAGYLLVWGVWRGLTTSFDLTVGFAAGQAWFQGRDPYDVMVLEEILGASSGGVDTGNRLDALRNVYLPATLPLFVPFGVVSWPVARVAMLGLNVAAAVFIAVGLGRSLGWRPTEPRALLLAAFVLALAPLHTSMAIGQSAVLATALLVAGLLLQRSGRATAAGVAYGLAMAVKIQIGLPFVAYQWWRRRWITAGSATAVLALLGVVAILRMAAAGVPWLSTWSANLALLSGPGGINDASPFNDDRYSLVNLQYLLHSLGSDRSSAEVITLAVVAAIALVALLLLFRVRDERRDLLAFAVIAPLSLLVVYHRFYDAVLLAFPIAWAVSRWEAGERRLAGAMLLLSADFLLPAQTGLHDLQQRQILPLALTDNPVWTSILMTQHVWALVLMVPVLLWHATRMDRQTRQKPSAAPLIP
jgi:hypothetical protein